MRITALLVILMLAGMLWSRALLSIGMMGLFFFAIVFHFSRAWRIVKSSGWLVGLTILFLIPLITYIWSEDKSQWWRSVQVKLPLLLMPFCIPVFRSLDKKTEQILFWILMSLIFLSSTYSYWQYFNTPGMTDLYLKAKVLPVAMSNDHVRYSWLLVIGYSWLLYKLLDGSFSRIERPFAWFLLVYLVIFIHVLAAKTGLLGFYLVSMIMLLVKSANKWRWLFLALILLIPVISWSVLPSFRNRVKFITWDFQNYTRGGYVEGLSDAPRMVSYDAGLAIIEESPFTGVGAGDVLGKTWSWYDKNAPYLQDYERLLPSNEILMYGCTAGIVAAILCLLCLVQAFFIRDLRRNMLWISFHIVAFAGFMYEIGLEVQHGVFLFSFFSCWFFARLSPAAATA